MILEPAVIAKSNIILDVKPWDDETDMKVVEQHVRSIEADGLLWGACKELYMNYILCGACKELYMNYILCGVCKELYMNYII